MKKFVLLASLLLAGCATTGGTTPPVSTIITEIEQGVQQACGFVVNPSSIQAILSSFGPGGVVAGTIIAGICAAVTPPANSKLSAVRYPTYRGVRIKGHFIH